VEHFFRRHIVIFSRVPEIMIQMILNMMKSSHRKIELSDIIEKIVDYIILKGRGTDAMRAGTGIGRWGLFRKWSRRLRSGLPGNRRRDSPG
jgi:hypothetical protein